MHKKSKYMLKYYSGNNRNNFKLVTEISLKASSQQAFYLILA